VAGRPRRDVRRGPHAGGPGHREGRPGPAEEGDRGRQPQRQLRGGGQEARVGDEEVRRRQVQPARACDALPRPRRDAGAERRRRRGEGQFRPGHQPRRVHRPRSGLQDAAARWHLGRREEERRGRRWRAGCPCHGGAAAHGGRLHDHAGRRGAGAHAAARLRRVRRQRGAHPSHRQVQGRRDGRLEVARSAQGRPGLRRAHPLQGRHAGLDALLRAARSSPSASR